MVSVLRRERATNRWCIISPGRFSRPGYVKESQGENKQAETETQVINCPFCPGKEGLTPPTIRHYVKNGQWVLRVVPNKYPALSLEVVKTGQPLKQKKEGVHLTLPGFGAHEIIIDTFAHGKHFADFTNDEANDLFWVFRERIADLRGDPRFNYILIFRNEGEAAGASLGHSHCQLIGLPVVPPLIQWEIDVAEQYYDEEGDCVYCATLKQELESGERVFFKNEHVVAFCPYASRSPYEIWVLPTDHLPRYEETTSDYIYGLAKGMREIVSRLSHALNCPAYNFYLHNSPLRHVEAESRFHHHFEIVPRITKLGGFEWGTGLYINVISPEEAARELREVKG